jgi:tetratricopeptide (TPR) repeat protein
MEGMDPSMMSAATEMFAKMTPEQRAQMQEQASKLDPAQIQQAMNAMKSMTPEQRAQMENMARNSTPEDVLKRSAAATDSRSEALKAEGNALFKQGKFPEASAKYLEAIQFSTVNDHSVLKSCHLNLSSCSLQLGEFESCVTHCNSVLEIDSMNMKAYYRRGQAYMGMKMQSPAVDDLEKALTLAGEHDAVLIREKLSMARVMENSENPELVNVVVIEEVTMERTSVEETVEDVEYDSAPSSAAPPPQANPPPPAMDPEAIKNAAKMMETMDPATMEQMMKMSGAPAGMTMDPSMIKMAAKMMETMSPEEIQRMQDMSRTFVSQGPAAAAGARENPSMENFSPSSMDDMRKMAQNPAMLKHMKEMMKNMDPDALSTMMKSSGVNVTPEQAKKMADQLGNLNDTQLDRIAKVVSFIGSVASMYQRTKNYIMKNPSMALAILVLIIALFLRWKGIL